MPLALRIAAVSTIGLMSTYAALANAAATQAPAQRAHSMSAEEHRALQTARDFEQAFSDRDAARAATYVEPDVIFRADAARSSDLSRGREQLRMQLARIFTPRSNFRAGTVDVKQIEAIGGSQEVLVIVRRVDNFTMNGREIHLPVGSFFRINAQDGRIIEWLDVPLVPFNVGAPRAAAGGH
ncbi:MAG TPA: nuclear transport factor 2 family protein [Steroidobacteraceae bacterium]|nr:nuclear transport factor 2 family protein [Steroidobacteraceae bacterium]